MERTVTELYRVHVRFVERVLRRSGVADRDIADASQEVFVVVHRRLSDFEGRASAQTWLYRIAWNVASEYRRRAYRRRELLDGDHEVADEVASPAEVIEAQRSVSALLDAIDRLDADKREALICHELDEQPMIAVATRLGIPLKTAFSRLYAARRALRLDLRKQGWACLPWWGWPFERIGSTVRAWRGHGSSWITLPARGLAAVVMIGLAPAQPPVVPAFVDARSDVRVEVDDRVAVAVNDHVKVDDRVATIALARPPRAPATVATQPPAVAPPLVIALDDLTVVRPGHIEVGLGPFGESPLADPPLVEPHRHPRTKLVLPARNR